jgi:hypothetical protein
VILEGERRRRRRREREASAMAPSKRRARKEEQEKNSKKEKAAEVISVHRLVTFLSPCPDVCTHILQEVGARI